MKFSVFALALFLLGASPSFASAVLPSSYGTATHSNPAWQDLSAPWDAGGSGVYWRINSTNPYDWSHDTSLQVGDTIQFLFSMHKSHVGRHYADFLKAWVDWDQDGTFDEGTGINDPGDVVMFDMHEVVNRGDDAVTNVYYLFTSNLFTITADMIGDLYLRARVACSESLGSQSPTYDYLGNFEATGLLGQGEVEEWALNVSPTPVPPSLLLLGTGLIGFAAANRKRFRKA